MCAGSRSCEVRLCCSMMCSQMWVPCVWEGRERERESMMFGCNASVAYKLLIRAHCFCGYTSVLLMKEWKIQLFRSDETRWITAHEVHWIGCAGESVSPKLYVCGGAFWMIPPYISVSASLEKVYIKLFVKLLH